MLKWCNNGRVEEFLCSFQESISNQYKIFMGQARVEDPGFSALSGHPLENKI